MTNAIARSGPVHFQSLEAELELVRPHFRGETLNAGCGDRDLGPWLAAQGITRLINYDLQSAIEGAVLGSLENMPFADGTFQTILCNAVLEHVADINAVMAEIARVLAPGGRAVIAVPFLQPYHPCPGDFRRYTAQGLSDLGTSHGLASIAVHPVHSAAQSIGWILWEIAKEKGRLWKMVVWPIVFAWTRISLKTDPKIRKNANTFQIVFEKP